MPEAAAKTHESRPLAAAAGEGARPTMVQRRACERRCQARLFHLRPRPSFFLAYSTLRSMCSFC